MKMLRIYQQQLRKQKRAQELQNFKANSRNALLYFTSNNKCLLCSDDSWIYSKNSYHAVNLVLTIFRDGQVCAQHNNLLIQKTKHSLMEVPNNYRKTMAPDQDKNDTKKQVIRKMVLLLQLLDEKIFSLCQKLQQQIQVSFQEKDNFVLNLMDCAYGYCQWPIQQQGYGDQQWHKQITMLSFQFFISILNKFPFMVCNFLEEYPLQALLSKCNSSNRIYLYQSISLLLQNCWINAIKYQSTIVLIECALTNHLQEIRNIVIPRQLIDGIACWIYAMICTGMPFQYSFLCLIKQFCCRISQSCDLKAAIGDCLSKSYHFIFQINNQNQGNKQLLQSAKSCQSHMEVEE